MWKERLRDDGKDTKKYHFYSHQQPPETTEDPVEAPQRPRLQAQWLWKYDN